MKKLLLLCLIAVAFSATQVQAQGMAVGVRAGSHGPGLELSRSILPNLNMRLGAGFLPIDRYGTYTEEDMTVGYDVHAAIQTGALLVDFYPLRGTLRLSGGLMYNGTAVDVSMAPQGGFTAGNRTFSEQQVGSLSGRLDYASKIGPYLGLGFGNPVAPAKGIGFMFDLGAMYSGAPQFVMEGTGMIGPTAEQGELITEKLQGFRFFPVLSLGMSYQF